MSQVDFSKSYERRIEVAYSSLGQKTDSFGNNMHLRYAFPKLGQEKFELVSSFTDEISIRKHITSAAIKYLDCSKTNPTILRIADFGGAEGFLLRFVRKELLNNGIYSVGVFIDKELHSGKTYDAFLSYRSEDPNVRNRVFPIAGDFTKSEEINIKSGSLGLILLRNTIQYFGKNKLEVFDAAFQKLKKGGLLITYTPTSNKENQSNINHFWAEHAQIIQGLDIETSLNSHYFPTLEEIEIYGNQAGFEVLESYLATDMPFKVSVENMTNSSRFKTPNEAQKAQIQALFEKYFQSDHYFHIPGVVVFRKS